MKCPKCVFEGNMISVMKHIQIDHFDFDEFENPNQEKTGLE